MYKTDNWKGPTSPTWWTRVCTSSRSWWWTGKPGVLQYMGSQNQIRLSDSTELNRYMKKKKLNIPNHLRNVKQNHNEVLWYRNERYHLSSVKMPIIRSLHITNIGKDVETRKLQYMWWNCKLVHPLWKTIWKFLKRLNVEQPMMQ